MILWTGRNDVKLTSSDFLAVGLKDGYLHLRYNLGSGESLIIFNETRVDDNNWHQIKATRLSYKTLSLIFIIQLNLTNRF